MKAYLPALAAALCGCGGPSPKLNLSYDDELVEAPTRSIDVMAVTGSDCDRIQSREHDHAGDGETIRARRATRYPIGPDLDIFADFPKTEPIDLDVAAYDGSLLQVSRACTRVTLDDVDTIDLRLHTLPLCEREPSTLDVMIVLDTSRGIDLADPARAYLDALDTSIVVGLTATVTFGLVTFGHNDAATELVPATTDRALVSGVVQSLRRVQSGRTRLFDGVAKGASLVRARAVCGRRPVLLLVTGLADDGSDKRFEDAGIGLFATRGDTKDDVFTIGIGMSLSGYTDLEDLIPPEIGQIEGAQTDVQIVNAFKTAKAAIDALLPGD